VALIKVASNATIVLMSRALEEVAREAIELSQEERLVLARILLEGCYLPGYPIIEAEQTWEEGPGGRINVDHTFLKQGDRREAERRPGAAAG
jgi:hypothetical protein